ncbi:MAG: CARDB domain-containing protein [Acidobacteriota bacterium]
MVTKFCGRTACLGWLMVSLFSVALRAQPVPPVFQGITIQVAVTEDPNSGSYMYGYTLTNPASNTAELSDFEIVVGGAETSVTLGSSAGWAPIGIVSNPPQPPFVLVPNQPFVDWAMWDDMPNPPSPGTSAGPFSFQSPRPPTIREAWINPWIQPYLDALATYEGGELLPSESDPINLSYIRKVQTLGPLGVDPGSFAHWNEFISDVATAGQLGWISDAALLSTIQSNLSAARQAAVAQDQAMVNAKLQAVIDATQAAAPSQRTSEGYALVYYNALYLQQNLPWPCAPKLTLTPASATHAIGQPHTATAMLVNVANGQPIANNYVDIEVTDGPQRGQGTHGTTAGDGTFSFTYTGTKVGVDTLRANTGMLYARQGAATKGKGTPTGKSHGRQGESLTDCTANGVFSEPVTVSWTGGPDLTVPIFIPPLLISAPGQTFYITETTMNIGILPAGPSITRYYLSTSSPVDPATATVVGERAIPALAPGEKSSVETAPYVIPPNLPAGNYYLDACADADHQVFETNESNNCASNQLQVATGVMPPNRPPDCSQASASPALLWPPNHKLVSIAITGVTDPDGDPVTIQITGITQDEPTNGLGDGDTCPDGFGVGSAQAQVRAERSGTGNGRVYAISFTAGDGKGGTCSGTVRVGVPHDQKDTPIDDGQSYDSTRCP